eukprot:Nk52_evm1s1285 gene=Nk52_evmTU1s1285
MEARYGSVGAAVDDCGPRIPGGLEKSGGPKEKGAELEGRVESVREPFYFEEITDMLIARLKDCGSTRRVTDDSPSRFAFFEKTTIDRESLFTLEEEDAHFESVLCAPDTIGTDKEFDKCQILEREVLTRLHLAYPDLKSQEGVIMRQKFDDPKRQTAERRDVDEGHQLATGFFLPEICSN